MNRFPEFGAELRRPFEVAEQCYDCTEFYVGCEARPEDNQVRCLDYLRLPDVGVDGQTGQVFPPSRMQGRKKPRLVQRQDVSRKDAPKQLRRRTSPVSITAGKRQRVCACGAVLGRRQRYCPDCRAKRRAETLSRRRRRQEPSAPVETASDLLFPAPTRLSLQATSRAHS
jgi:hypothetical protein